MSRQVVVIVGGGASGALLATALLRRSDDVRVIVIEPRERLGRGTAYSTACAAHLLNVPAAKMSAFPGEPHHFFDWLERHYPARFAPHSFVPRSIYGDYLDDIVTSTRAAANERFEHVRAIAQDLDVSESGITVACSSGVRIDGDVAVLACGNAPPDPWPVSIDRAADHGFFDSAWAPGALVPNDPGETVVLIGTGLTAVDAVLALRENGHTGVIHMISRRGLLPHEHRFGLSAVADMEIVNVESARASVLLRAIRSGARSRGGWRNAVDSVRPKTNELWRSLSIEERRRAFRRLMPYWSVHRHRMAPEIAQELAALTAAKKLQIAAGRIGRVVAADGSLYVPVKPRGKSATITIQAQRVINCSSPGQNCFENDRGLLRSLFEQKRLSPTGLGLGIDVSPHGAAIGADMGPSDRIFTMGPMRFGSLIETTAIPEIRVQAIDLADHLRGRLEMPRNLIGGFGVSRSV